jgi:hypothetical protein
MNKQPNVVFEALSAGRGTWEVIDGIDHFVAPIVAMVQGVVHAMNAKRPEFVPADQLTTYGWDNRPVFINHPMVDDVPVASFHPKVHGSHIGFTRNPRIAGEGDNRKLCMEVCLVKTKLTPELLAHVDSDSPFNVSMGAFVNSVKAEGEYNGKKYFSEWHDIDPDHMALLPATLGACSWEMGCGVRAAGELRAAWMDKEGIDDHGRGAAAKASEKATKLSKKAHDATGHEAARTAHEEAATAHDQVVTNMIGYGTIKEGTPAAAHHALANGHRQHATNHYHSGLSKRSRTAEETSMDVHCYDAWLEQGDETTELLKVLRNISQDARDKMDKGDFAGPNESFPIEIPGDVHDAAASIGRAKGDRASIKRKIIAIAYRKGADFVAQLPDAWKKKSDAKAAGMFARAIAAIRESFKVAVDADRMSSNQLNTKLYEALKEVEPRCSSVIDVFPVIDPTHVVYQTFTPSADPMGYGTYELLERSFTLSDSGVVTLGPSAIEVEAVVTYEPVEGASPTAAEARPDAPCGCKGKTTVASDSQQQEVPMEKQARIKALIAASNGMFAEGDMKMLEGATDEQLARYEAAAKATTQTITDAAAAVTAAAATKEKAPETATFEQLLAAAKPEVREAITAQVTALASKKEATIKVLTDSGKCKFSKEQLAGFDQPMLDNLVTLAGVTGQGVDHSLVLPPAAGGQEPFVAAQTNESFNERVKAKSKK